MVTYLLDVNVLVALAWREHVLHEPAQRWFSGLDGDTWATTTVTESGFIRVSMNVKVSPNAVPWPAALEMVSTIRSTRGHRWWPNEVDLIESPLVRRAPVMSHRQVTDVHLAAVAAYHGGRLATLDQGVPEALHPDDRAVVAVLPAT
ncbi:MAG: TA system VapC family ribonuclease toxin [Mycobacteriales bacterium]